MNEQMCEECPMRGRFPLCAGQEKPALCNLGDSPRLVAKSRLLSSLKADYPRGFYKTAPVNQLSPYGQGIPPVVEAQSVPAAPKKITVLQAREMGLGCCGGGGNVKKLDVKMEGQKEDGLTLHNQGSIGSSGKTWKP